jgi:hypothetical protein
MEPTGRTLMPGSGVQAVSPPVVSPIAENIVTEWYKIPPGGVQVLSAGRAGRPYHFVVVDVRDPKDGIDSVTHWTSEFVAALRGRSVVEYFVNSNDNFQPSVLVVGKHQPYGFRRKVHAAGCIVYDLELPSNATLTDPQHVVSDLASREHAIPAQPPRRWPVDPKADPAPYYEPVRGVTPQDVRDYLAFLNHQSP